MQFDLIVHSCTGMQRHHALCRLTFQMLVLMSREMRFCNAYRPYQPIQKRFCLIQTQLVGTRDLPCVIVMVASQVWNSLCRENHQKPTCSSFKNSYPTRFFITDLYATDAFAAFMPCFLVMWYCVWYCVFLRSWGERLRAK